MYMLTISYILRVLFTDQMNACTRVYMYVSQCDRSTG